MNIKLQLPTLMHLRPRIAVVGVGGAGSNAVNNMIASGLSGVNFVVANTDAQSLANSAAENRIQLGAALTEGLGAGAKPEIGRAAAEEAIEDIRAQVAGSHMVFVAAGMGGGTGTGAAAVIARIARECGALTVGVVTKPFHFEGTRRMRAAELGVAALKPEVDTLIVIPNQNLFRIANERTTFAEAFVLADQVLYSGIACVVDLIVKEGLINLDFADVRSIMSGMGTAMMGTGEASGEKRAVLAAEEAISNPLLDDISLSGAKGLLVSITGSRELKLYEVDEAAQRVRQEVDGEANIIVGATFDDSLGDRIRVSIVASGMERLGESAAGWQAQSASQAPSSQAAIATDNQPPFIEPYPEISAAPFQAPALPQVHPGYQGYPAQYGHPIVDGSSRRLPPSLPQTGNPDFTRALSEALEPHAEPEPPQARRSNLPDHATWASQSGAHFQEAPPQLGENQLASLGYSAGHRMPGHSQGFHPQPPAEPRRLARRLPEVGDFPAVGQREYHAKSVQYGEPSQPHPPRNYVQPHATPAPKRGFFARLFRRRSKSSEDAHTSATYPQAQSTLRSSQTSAASAGWPKAGSAAGGTNRPEDEAYELPAFFGAERK